MYIFKGSFPPFPDSEPQLKPQRQYHRQSGQKVAKGTSWTYIHFNVSLSAFVLKVRTYPLELIQMDSSRSNTFSSKPKWPPLMFAVIWEPEFELCPWCSGPGSRIPLCDWGAFDSLPCENADELTHIFLRPMLKLTICYSLSSISWPKWKMVCVTLVLIR